MMRPGLMLRNHSRLLVLLLIFFSTVGAYMVSRVVLKGEKYERFARFEGAASNSALAFHRVMEKTETVVRSIVSFYDSSDQVTRTDFRHFVTDAIRLNPGIEALAWLPKVSHRERDAFVAKIRGQGLPGFDLLQRGPGGRMVKADVRPYYYPMTYAEPSKANRGSLGFDVGSDPARLSIIDRSANGNKWVATSRVMVTHGIVQEPAVFLFAPIYGMRAAEVQKLQYPEMTLHGFTLVVLNIDRLMASAFEDMRFEKNFALYLYDVTGDADAEPLSSWGSADTVQTAISLSALPGQKISSRFEIGGREWALVAVDKAASSGVGMALLVFYALIAFAVVMAIALGVQLTRHETIRQQVEERTAELERHRTQLEQIVADRTMVIEEQALELQQALRQEKQLNESQKNFIAVTSQAFRTPLAIIESSAQKLKRSAGNISGDDVLARSEKISLAVSRLLLLLDSALASSKIEDGKFSFDPAYCDISALVKQCCVRQQEMALLPRVRFDPPALAEEVYVDAVAIEQVVSHLLGEAVTVTDDDGEVVVELQTCGEDFCISIISGGGEDDPANALKGEDAAANLMKAIGFASSERDRDDEPGLTLTQCKFLVELHGGTLKTGAQTGAGSRYTIRLPKRAADGRAAEVA